MRKKAVYITKTADTLIKNLAKENESSVEILLATELHGLRISLDHSKNMAIDSDLLAYIFSSEKKSVLLILEVGIDCIEDLAFLAKHYSISEAEVLIMLAYNRDYSHHFDIERRQACDRKHCFVKFPH